MAKGRVNGTANGVSERSGNAASNIGSAGAREEFIDGGNDIDESVSISNDGGIESQSDNIGDSSSGVGYVTVDPEQLGEYIREQSDRGNGNGDRTRRKRSDAGQKRGTRSGRKKAEETVEPFLMMAHQWAAVLLKTPELALEQQEAKQLSDAYAVFCQHHDIPVLSEKRMSEINLIGAMVMVYGPRFIAVRNRVKEETRVRRAKNVTPFGQPMQQQNAVQ